MIGRRTIIGICIASALAAAVIGAQSASAQQTYTCSKTGTGDFLDKNCKNLGLIGKSPWGHVAFAGETVATISGELTKLKSVQSGVTLEIQSTSLTGVEAIENKQEGALTWGEGTAVFLLEGVTVTAPVGKGCKVKGGEILTKELRSTSKNLTNELKYSPASGEELTSFTVEECSNKALNHSYTLKGSVTGATANGTTSFTHAAVTAENTLSLFGQKVGLEAGLVITGPNGDGIVWT